MFELQNATLSRNLPLDRLKCERGSHFRIAKRTPVEDFALQMSKMRARCSFLNCKMQPYQGICPLVVQNASVVPIFALQNAHLASLRIIGPVWASLHLFCPVCASLCLFGFL